MGQSGVDPTRGIQRRFSAGVMMGWLSAAIGIALLVLAFAAAPPPRPEPILGGFLAAVVGLIAAARIFESELGAAKQRSVARVRTRQSLGAGIPGALSRPEESAGRLSR